jgi:trimethylamine--corrinoid protein Co-methyltransferase
VADNNSCEQWEQDGSKDAPMRANAIWKSMLKSYEPPAIDISVDEALQDFISRKKAEFPDQNY